LEGKVLRQIFAGVVIVSALRLLVETRKPKIEEMPDVHIPPLLGTGFVAGLVSAFAGVGGGVLTIPVMHSLLKFPLKKALGTSSATIVITAFFSLVGYTVSGLSHAGLPRWTLGYVDLWHGAALAIGSIFFSRIGAYASFKTHPFRLRKAFIFFTLVVLTYMLLK
jgi:uncharacterized membrane protein YfcA